MTMKNVDSKYKNYVSGTFDSSLPYYVERIMAEGLDLISTEQAALLRIKTKFDIQKREAHGYVHDIHSAFFTREGYIWIPKENRMYLTKKSPCITSYDLSRSSIIYKGFFYITTKMVKEALEDSCPVNKSKVPVEDLVKCSEFRFLFGDQAEPYAEYLKNLGVKNFFFDKVFTKGHTYGFGNTCFVKKHGYYSESSDEPIAGQCDLGGLFFYLSMPYQRYIDGENKD